MLLFSSSKLAATISFVAVMTVISLVVRAVVVEISVILIFLLPTILPLTVIESDAPVLKFTSTTIVPVPLRLVSRRASRARFSRPIIVIWSVVALLLKESVPLTCTSSV